MGKKVLLFAFLFFLFLTGKEGRAENLNLSYQYGIQNTAKSGRSLPLFLTLENTEEQVFSGNLRVLFAESNQSIVEYSYPLVVEGNSKKDLVKNLSLPTGVNQMLLSIENKAGEQINSQRVGLDISGTDAELFVGILSEKGEGIGYLHNARVNNGLLESRTFSFQAESFPKEESVLSLLDLLIIRDIRFSDLSKEQENFINSYIEQGGVVLFSLSGERRRETLGDNYAALLEKELDFQERSLHLGTEGDLASGSTVSLQSSPVQFRGGREALFSENQPYLSVLQRGNGLLAVLGYDLTEVERYATEDSSYVGRLLLALYGQNRLDSLSISASEKSLKQYWDLEELMNLSDLSKLPSLVLYFAILFPALLFLGPGLYLLMRSQRNLKYYRLSLLLFSLFLGVIVWSLGMGTRFNGSFLSYLKLSQISENTVEEQNYINLRSPDEKNISLSIKPEYTVNPIVKGMDFTGDLTELLQKENLHRMDIQRDREESLIHILKSDAFSPHYFNINKKIPNSKGAIQGQIHYYQGKLSGSLKNATDYSFYDCFFYLFGRMVKCGKWESGAELDLSTLESIAVPVGDYEYSSTLISSGNGKNFLRYILSERMHGYFPDARFFGFIREEQLGFTEEKNIENYGVHILTQSISLDRKEGSTVEYNALSRDPVVSSGEYDLQSNTMNPMIPLEIHYQLGEEQSIEGIRFENISLEEGKLLQNFRGNMALYNYRTGGFDLLPSKDGTLEGEKLAPYLSEKKELNIRFVPKESNVSPQIRQYLPQIYVLAKEDA
jgi:hypothetical protein